MWLETKVRDGIEHTEIKEMRDNPSARGVSGSERSRKSFTRHFLKIPTGIFFYSMGECGWKLRFASNRLFLCLLGFPRYNTCMSPKAALPKSSTDISQEVSEKVSTFWQDFREFALQGNVIDLTVGVVIGTAFKQLTTSLVEDIVMPPIGLLLGNADFTELYINLSGGQYATLADAQAAGAATLNYGLFITNLIDFFLVALSVYVVLRFVLRHSMKSE